MWIFEYFAKAGDLSALMLLLMAMGDRDGLQPLVRKAGELSFFFSFCFFNVLMELFVDEKGQNNLVFAILLQLGNSTACQCVDLRNSTCS